jgi:hypothetical protein
VVEAEAVDVIRVSLVLREAIWNLRAVICASIEMKSAYRILKPTIDASLTKTNNQESR